MTIPINKRFVPNIASLFIEYVFKDMNSYLHWWENQFRYVIF